MSVINNILKVFVGDKSQKDIKAIRPIVEKINQLQQSYETLSHDELRGKTIEFKQKIKEARAPQDEKIASYRTELEAIVDIDAREEIYSAIDNLEKEAYTATEKVLNDILPEAFAVVKETARRFSTNSEITVTATERDQEFAQQKPYVSVNGQQATWLNRWQVAGKELTWSMIHYDVQMIGGIVLHQGKVA